MTSLNSTLKSRVIILPIKVYIVKIMFFFPVVIYGCKRWTIKKAESQRIYAFELWCWKRLLRIPWLARRSNQSVLKEINLEYSFEVLMLKHQYFGHLMRRANSLKRAWCWVSWGQEEKRVTEDEMAGWHHWLNGYESEQTLVDSEGQESLVCCIHGVTKSQTWLSD